MDSSLIRIRAMREFPKPLLLKDHLLDDMSSCSSTGFKSFPRSRSQCCTTVRFFHHFDRKRQQQKKYLNFNKKPSRSTLSAFRRRVITAMRRLPFAAAKSPEKKKLKGSFFARSFSRKILEKSCGFWKTRPEQKEIGRWKSFDQLMEEEPELSVRDSKISNSWSGGNFTASSDSNSSLEVNLNLPDETNDVVENGADAAENSGVSTNLATSRSGSDNTDAPIHTTKKQWSSDHEKEQFSPMSVLDCPFGDEDEVSSPFQHTLARVIGTNTRLVKEIQIFECLAKLEPVNLAKLFALQPDNSDNESSGSPPPHPSPSLDEKSISDIEEEENEAERMALELLGRVKANYLSSSGLNLTEDKLLLDFFREKLTYKCANTKKQRVVSSFEKGMLGEAEDWIDGQNRHEVFIEWEIMKNRHAYVEDMDKRDKWRTLDQESEGVTLELENAVFVELMNEVLLEISN